MYVCVFLDLEWAVNTLKLHVISYLDLDFVGCVDFHRSTSGYIFMMVGGAISWRSVKQTLTATSTMKVEFLCFLGYITWRMA